jgi:hypothetical protein
MDSKYGRTEKTKPNETKSQLALLYAFRKIWGRLEEEIQNKTIYKEITYDRHSFFSHQSRFKGRRWQLPPTSAREMRGTKEGGREAWYPHPHGTLAPPPPLLHHSAICEHQTRLKQVHNALLESVQREK